jgi:hypothetical protein
MKQPVGAVNDYEFLNANHDDVTIFEKRKRYKLSSYLTLLVELKKVKMLAKAVVFYLFSFLFCILTT